jgi:predicted SnoaL-like aldol condensation-catalyzing enzyme
MTTTNAADANKALGVAGITGIFIDRDPSVLDRLLSNDYRQHNPQIANGTAALKVLIGKLPSDFKYEPGLVMADGDYVSIHGRYFGYPVIVSSWISTWRTDWLRCVAASYQPDDHGCRVTTRRRRCSRIIVNPSDQRQS